MRHWLMKTEPDEFSIDDLRKRKREPWGGVRNYQARNYMRDDMRVGDPVLFYHSSCDEVGIAGIATIARAAYPDPSQFDPESDYYDPKSPPDAPRWLQVDVAYKRRFKRVVSLNELQQHAAALEGLFVLRRGNRLSITPVSAEHYAFILALE